MQVVSSTYTLIMWCQGRLLSCKLGDKWDLTSRLVCWANVLMSIEPQNWNKCIKAAAPPSDLIPNILDVSGRPVQAFPSPFFGILCSQIPQGKAGNRVIMELPGSFQHDPEMTLRGSRCAAALRTTDPRRRTSQ